MALLEASYTQVNKGKAVKKPKEQEQRALRLQCPLVPTASSCWVPSRGGSCEWFLVFHEECQSALFIMFKHHHVSTANEPKRNDQLSPPTPALLAPLLHLSKLWAPIALPKGGWRESVAVLSAAQLSGTAWLAAQAHCLSASFQVTSINILSHPCQVPGPHVHPQPPLPLGLASFPRNKCFISPIDGYLGIVSPVTHQIEHHAHLTEGVIISSLQR